MARHDQRIKGKRLLFSKRGRAYLGLEKAAARPTRPSSGPPELFKHFTIAGTTYDKKGRRRFQVQAFSFTTNYHFSVCSGNEDYPMKALRSLGAAVDTGHSCFSTAHPAWRMLVMESTFFWRNQRLILLAFVPKSDTSIHQAGKKQVCKPAANHEHQVLANAKTCS